MAPRTILKIMAVIAVIAFVRYANMHAKQHHHKSAAQPPSVTKPLPAAAPTVAMPRQTPSPKPHKTKEYSSSPDENNDDGESNIRLSTQRELGHVVKLYASWSGPASQETLVRKLKSKEPFITNEAVTKIQAEWNNTPPLTTFKIVPLRVVNISNLYALPLEPDKGTATVFLAVRKLFTPVSTKPYSQTAVQPYTVNMQVISRQWRVVGIVPQNNVSTSPSH
jgi:hypothetical protein